MATAIAYKDPKLPLPVELPDGPEWTAMLRVLGPHVAETLVIAARTLCPHDGLPERVYRRVIVHLDEMAARSPAAAQRLSEFVDSADAGMPMPFAELSEGFRVAVLKGMDPTPAFCFVQRATVRFLYDDIEVWTAFGYEGASVHLGGYVDRGFNDLDWLPEPPADEQR